MFHAETITALCRCKHRPVIVILLLLSHYALKIHVRARLKNHGVMNPCDVYVCHCEMTVYGRTRDMAHLNDCDIVVDVGATYDASNHRYDHHQRQVFLQWPQFESIFDTSYRTPHNSI